MTNDYSWALTPQHDYLAHFGTKGMKWGERKWQNQDGTYTPAGLARYFGGGKNRVMSYRQYNKAALKGRNDKAGVTQKAVSAAQQKNISKAGRQAVTGAAMTAAGLYSMKKGYSTARQAATMLGVGVATGVALKAIGTKKSRKAEATLKSEYAKYKDTRMSELGTASSSNTKRKKMSGRQKAALVAGTALSGYGLYKMARS